MQTQSGSLTPCRPWVLLLGPGQRLAPLPPLLRSHPGRPSGGPPDAIRALEDLGELFCELPDSGRLALDSDALPLELAGLVAAFLERRPGWELVLCGTDSSSGAARRLLRFARARWLPWPIDLEQLPSLAAAPASARGDESPGELRQVELRPRPRRALAPELRDEIERILGTPPAASPEDEDEQLIDAPPHGDDGHGREHAEAAPPAPRAARARPPAHEAPTAQAEPATCEPRPVLHSAAVPPPYFRDQIADLADIAQRVELATGIARERASIAARGGSTVPPALQQSLEDLDLEALRLVQFTRTLGFVAAPPARGEQRIELGSMVEELLGAVGREPHAPRYLLRAEAPLWVRADKSLLAQALDALIYLAHHCAGPEGTVRVEGKLESASGTSTARILVTFPSGPLEGLPPERALEPYALRRTLPELGPNALAAARGIVRGQGGELELRRRGSSELCWSLSLPVLEASAG